MVRTRFAPSPTGFMHIGNLRTALYEYLIAKSQGGTFVLRIEDTDRERLVEGSVDVIYNTLKIAGIKHDEGPDIGGDYGPYVQSERKDSYMKYAKQLVEKGRAYYCFCDKERLDNLRTETAHAKYDRHCLKLSKEEIEEKLANGVPFVIRQLIPEGETTFADSVFGTITVKNEEIEDQVMVKSDGMPTYNFANVIDDHLMDITHVVRGCEYLSSTPKYNILYDAFGWEIPTYVHLPLILNSEGEKLSKRRGDASFEDLLAEGFLPKAIINFITLLGFSPSDNREFFTLDELTEFFDIKGLSKSPSIFDMQKLTWMNGEYIKKLTDDEFYEMALPYLKEAIKTEGIDLKKVSAMVKTRVNFVKEVSGLVDFIDNLPEYDTELFVHKKMKTDKVNSLENLEKVVPFLEQLEPWNDENIHSSLMGFIESLEIKNGQLLWPIRTALSGKPTSPCGGTELLGLLGKAESVRRIKLAIEMLK